MANIYPLPLLNELNPHLGNYVSQLEAGLDQLSSIFGEMKSECANFGKNHIDNLIRETITDLNEEGIEGLGIGYSFAFNAPVPDVRAIEITFAVRLYEDPELLSEEQRETLDRSFKLLSSGVHVKLSELGKEVKRAVHRNREFLDEILNQTDFSVIRQQGNNNRRSKIYLMLGSKVYETGIFNSGENNTSLVPSAMPAMYFHYAEQILGTIIKDHPDTNIYLLSNASSRVSPEMVLEYVSRNITELRSRLTPVASASGGNVVMLKSAAKAPDALSSSIGAISDRDTKNRRII